MAVAPFGSWPSDVTADRLVEQVVSLGQLATSEQAVYWNEGRPSEGGRQVVVRWTPEHGRADAIPAGCSARTTVHEYGGGAYAVHGDAVLFSDFADQRLYRVDGGQGLRPLTPEPPAPGALRYADARVSPDGAWLVCVRERHDGDGGIDNDVVALPTDGAGSPLRLIGGHDFFAAPRLSPDGDRLAWLCWDHPRMPWDGTELWVADVGPGPALGERRRVAGGPEESVSQPRWSPDGTLHWVSDRTGWWNLYADDGGAGLPLAPMEAEFSGPDWVFGQSSFTFLADGRLVAAWSRNGVTRLGVLAPGSDTLRDVETPYTVVTSLQAFGDGVVALAASPREETAVVAIDVPSGRSRVVERSRAGRVDPRLVSEPDHVEFPTEGGRTAHAFHYPPANGGYEGPEGERPPLVVLSHGGPTGATSAVLRMEVLFWTSRGIAVVDVDYGGSTGYGRAYRRRLAGQWGVVDVDDCVNAARYLVERGDVDGSRLAIRGGSAGGYTTLCALTFRDVFAAGASYYGVADAEALAAQTHKFESHYLDGLIGPYPECRDLYRRRSPVHHAERLSAPLILFQGLEDRVVPPAQAEAMVAALRAKGLPFAYLTFAGEQHGFRRAETIKRAAEAELWFYGKVLGFQPADDLEPVPVENLPRPG